MRSGVRAILHSQQFGIVLVILILGITLTLFSGSHQDPTSLQWTNNFLNLSTLMQVATDASLYAIMAVGMTLVIVSAGIDLSVGSIYALVGIVMAMALRNTGLQGTEAILIGCALCLVIGTLCGVLNGVMICGLGVHPFIITLGTMLIFRGIGFVTSKAESVLVPQSLTDLMKAGLGLPPQVYPFPMLLMIFVAVAGWVILTKTTLGRSIFAIGGNLTAAKYAGIPVNKILIGVYALCGLTAGLAAFVGNSFYGAASSGDAAGYELYVIASAVVGGASLHGGKGSAISAMLGALLIALMKQSITLMHLNQNYQQIIIGLAIIVAVVIDKTSTALAERRQRLH